MALITASVPFEVPFTESLVPSIEGPDPAHPTLFTLPGFRTIPHCDLKYFLRKELDVNRLNKFHEYLWLAGRFGNIQPLHKQATKSRTIVPNERCDMHLLWQDTIIYIKPLPAWLLNVEFWRTHISPNPTLSKRAAGLLYTYTRMIVYQSDYRIAKESGLLPDGLDYADWSRFLVGVAQTLYSPDHSKLDRRYRYGHLRIQRLNAIARWVNILRSRPYNNTSDPGLKGFLGNFRWLLLCFVVLSVTLTAMQVGLATRWGLGDGRFEKVCWVVCVGSLVGIVLSGAAVLGLMVFLIVMNTGRALRYCWAVRRRRRRAQQEFKLSEC